MTPTRDAKAANVAEESRLIAEGETLSSVTETIASIPEAPRVSLGWLFGTLLAFGFVNLFLLAVTYLLVRGIGIWGVNIPVAWGFAIINFVWWIGIGHAGTFISAFLLLMHQDWRNAINRFAETMTLIAICCAGIFPLLHLGRPKLFYFLLPYPDTLNLWPQWRSALIWDIFAVGTYATVSLLFWYTGLVPDLATMRDRARNRFARFWYGVFALGWRNSARHWHRYESAYLLLGGLATPLVISVHSVVSLDFAIAIIPGWHSTIFPPYFVAGAIFSGFAMVLTLAIPIRTIYGLQGILTMKHIDNMAKVLLINGLIVTYGYIMEHFMAWYSSERVEVYMVLNRMFGHYAAVYWLVIACNVGVTQLLWFKWVRSHLTVLWIVSILINLGMWLERYMIVVTSLSRDFVPSSWGIYAGTIWDWATFLGTLGVFLFLFLVFIRLLPMISIAESRKLAEESNEP